MMLKKIIENYLVQLHKKKTFPKMVAPSNDGLGICRGPDQDKSFPEDEQEWMKVWAAYRFSSLILQLLIPC